MTITGEESSSLVESMMDDTTSTTPKALTYNNSNNKRLRSNQEKSVEEEQEDTEEEDDYDEEVWDTLSKTFRQVQTVLDKNRGLIQQVNENHQSKIPDNISKNVLLIREINGNISKVTSIYSDLSENLSNFVGQRRRIKNGMWWLRDCFIYIYYPPADVNKISARNSRWGMTSGFTLLYSSHFGSLG